MEDESRVEKFNSFRERMNEKIFASGNKVINRYFNLDTNTYVDGALPGKTKEMLGLVASMVLRCDDCISYHVGKCHEMGVTEDDLYEIFSVGLVVGGSIVIPHLRRAVEYWEEVKGISNIEYRISNIEYRILKGTQKYKIYPRRRTKHKM
jgi:AhpD family alkylhydroperoxidase